MCLLRVAAYGISKVGKVAFASKTVGSTAKTLNETRNIAKVASEAAPTIQISENHLIKAGLSIRDSKPDGWMTGTEAEISNNPDLSILTCRGSSNSCTPFSLIVPSL